MIKRLLKNIGLSCKDEEKSLPVDYILIDKQRHEQLSKTMFNPADDGLESEKRFSDQFNKEILHTMKACSDYLAQYGEFGSYKRYKDGLESDWFIGEDFYCVSRVLFIDILNPKLQSYSIIQGLRNILSSFPTKWMLMVGHNNDFDNKGQYVEREGEYYFWIREEIVEIYKERDEDLSQFYHSLRGQK